MLDLLSELSGLEEKENVIDEIKQEKLPLALYGAGEVALEVYEYLYNNGIEVTEVYVDDKFYSENLELFGKKVIAWTGLIRKYSKINIIWGNSNYEKGNQLSKDEHVNKIFYLFSMNYGVFDRTSLSYIQEKLNEFESVYELLEDQNSKDNYLSFLKSRVAGNIKYILDVYKKEMNFFNNDIFRISKDEVYLDVGAYDGDTIRLFLKENNGNYKFIYALEPDRVNRLKLKKYVEKNHLANVQITEKGAWDKEGTLTFYSNGEQLSGVIKKHHARGVEERITVQTLDTMFQYPEKITILKINYKEGVIEAIKGSESILKLHEPKLAITVGFDAENIRILPPLIKKINSRYKLFLRYNRGMISTLTLYGIIS